MHDHDATAVKLRSVEQRLVGEGENLALLLVYDRPQLADARPGLARTFFTQRCISDDELAQTIDAFRSVGAYVELFDGELPLLRALADGRLQKIPRPAKVIYNGINNYVGDGGFAPGRKALLPAVADSYGFVCSNSNAYACALGRHKFHYLILLRALGIRTPQVWHYRPPEGWLGASPVPGTQVIVKSTYESWSVGVTEESVFTVDQTCDDRVCAIANEIGQSVTVQEFISGPEVNVPIFSFPDQVVTPPVQAVLAKAPRDVDAIVTIDDNLHGGLSYEPFAAAEDVADQLQAIALETFNALELQSFARVDLRVDRHGDPWVIDVGVEPGLNIRGSASRSLSLLDFDHPSFVRLVIAAALSSRGLLPSSPARALSPGA